MRQSDYAVHASRHRPARPSATAHWLSCCVAAAASVAQADEAAGLRRRPGLRPAATRARPRGDQYSHWLHSAHAKAYASLGQAGGEADRPAQRHPGGAAGVARRAWAATPPPPRPRSGRRTTRSARGRRAVREVPRPGQRVHGRGGHEGSRGRDEGGPAPPTKRDCLDCHDDKGSHVAVHHKPLIDIEKAWKTIAHPVPEGGTSARAARGGSAPRGPRAEVRGLPSPAASASRAR